MKPIAYIIPTPLGDMRALLSSGVLHALDFSAATDGGVAAEPGRLPELLSELERQLADWWLGRRGQFDLPLAVRGTAFQRAVWAAVADVPRGELVSYAELAGRIGRPAAARAVGAALGRNPWLLVIPCHRVVGGNGALTGYAGGVERKRQLLAHERAVASMKI